MGGLFRAHHICDDELQGATAHNLISDTSKTHSKQKMAAVLDSLDPAVDTVILSFGEVDCRFHLRNSEQVAATVERYTQAIADVRTRGFRTIVAAVIGAVPQDNTWRQADYPSQTARGVVVKRFNAELADWCAANGVEFVSLDTMDEDGCLKTALCDDGVHLNERGEHLWVEWAKTAGLGTPERNVVYSPAGMDYYGALVSRVLGWPLFVNTYCGNVDTAYIIGLYDPPLYGQTLAHTRNAGRRIIHLCGSDVPLIRGEFLPEGATYLAETDGLAAELFERTGVEAAVATFPTNTHTDVSPLPEKPTLAFYKGTNGDKYGIRIAEAIAECFPDVDMMVYGFGDFPPSAMPQVIKAASVYLRFAEHDGSANSCREYMEAGRRVVACNDLPYVKRVSRNDFAGIVATVRKALAETEPDYEAAAYYRAFNSEARYLGSLEGVL